MKNIRRILAVCLMTISVGGPAMAQSFYMTTDHGMRTSKLIGVAVYNDRNEKIGVIDDIMLPAMGGEVKAVLSVGGFLGTGKKLVQVPLSHVQLMGDKPMMPDGGKTALMAMPYYNYGSGDGGR